MRRIDRGPLPAGLHLAAQSLLQRAHHSLLTAPISAHAAHSGAPALTHLRAAWAHFCLSAAAV